MMSVRAAKASNGVHGSNTTSRVPAVSAGPLCVQYEEDEGDEEKNGWCLAKGGPDKDVMNQQTGCDKYVTFPSKYKRRQPTCTECLAAIAEGRTPKQLANVKLLLD